MQTISMILMFMMHMKGKPDHSQLQKSALIMIVLMCEHIFSYCAGIFRNWEIEKYGKLDINGIVRAKKESMLSTFEIFLDCIIFGYSTNYLFGLSTDFYSSAPYVHFWIVFDCCMMLLSLIYIYLTQLMIVQSEITKNIFSLHFLQHRLLK